MCPLEKGVRGIETGHQMPGRSWRAWKAIVAMESPKALIVPLKRVCDGGLTSRHQTTGRVRVFATVGLKY